MLRTAFTELLEIDYPVMSAPMSMHSGATLAAAVSMARGLGSFGAVDLRGPDWVREQIRGVRAKTDRPFAVGFITAFIPYMEKNFEVALDERAPVISLSFGSPEPWATRVKDSGALLMCQVQSLEAAFEAKAARADVIVVQGNEAGGHTGGASLLPLLTTVLHEVPDVPVLAAGGIADGRSLAAVLAAGAEGAWVGTAFLATKEAVEVSDAYKQRIVESRPEDTTFTRVYDVILGLPWPAGIGERVYNSSFVREWEGRYDEIADRRTELQKRTQPATPFDTEVSPVLMGEGVSAITSVRSASDVLHDVCDDAESLLRDRAKHLVR